MKVFLVFTVIFIFSCKPTQSLELESHKNQSSLNTDNEDEVICDDPREGDFSIECLQQAQLAGVISDLRLDQISDSRSSGSCFIGALSVDEVGSIKEANYCMGADYSAANIPVEPVAAPVVDMPDVPVTSTPISECRFVNQCWGFYSFRWYNNGESSSGYTCRCGLWIPG